MKSLFKFIQATAVVPLHMNGSSTKSPSFESVLIKYSITFMSFIVGCNLLDCTVVSITHFSNGFSLLNVHLVGFHFELYTHHNANSTSLTNILSLLNGAGLLLLSTKHLFIYILFFSHSLFISHKFSRALNITTLAFSFNTLGISCIHPRVSKSLSHSPKSIHCLQALPIVVKLFSLETL